MNKVYMKVGIACLFFLISLIIPQISNSQTWDFNSSSYVSTGYSVSGVGAYYKGTGGGTVTTGSTTSCNGYTVTVPTSSGVFYFQTAVDITALTVWGAGTGNNRSFSSLATSSTLNGTYTNLSGASGTGTISSGVCGSVVFNAGTTIPANTYIKITFTSGNVNITSIVLTPAVVSAPTIQAKDIVFSGVTSSTITASWTNGDGAKRAVFVKEGTQGTITNPSDGTSYTASADWSLPTGQLGSSGYYCVYDGTASTVALNNLNPSKTYWVQVFEYNGSGSSTKYYTGAGANNPKSQATPAAPVSYYYRSAVSSGNWGDASSWESSTDNSIWGNAGGAPTGTSADLAITIQNGHNITVNTGTVSADELTVASGGTLTVASGATLSITNGTGTDLTVNGTLVLAGSFASAASTAMSVNGTFENQVNAVGFSAGSGTMTINAGGTYKVNGYNGAAQLTFTNVSFTSGVGASGSTLYIAGISVCRLPANQNGNVVINTPTVGGSYLQTNPSTITGNLTVIGTTGINHAAGGSARSLTVSGSLNIQGGKYEVVASGTTSGGTSALTVNGDINVTGGKLYISSTTSGGTGTINAKGNINYSAGVFGLPINITTGHLVLNGTAAQSINITTADSTLTTHNLTISNNTGISITGTSTLDVQGTVAFTVSNASLATGGLLKLKSLSSTTARIADITNAGANTGNSITGSIIHERYIPAKSARAWSLISSPVAQTLSDGWQQQIHITGSNTGTNACTIDGTTGFDITTTNAPSAYTYNASLTAGSRWVAVPSTLATSTAAGKGFRFNIRGPRTAGCSLLDGSSLVPAAVTLTSTGTISNADKNLGSFSITYPNAASGDNYVLVGNPYPSQISFSALRASNASVLNNNYAIYAPGNTAGNYAYWDPTGGTYTGGNTGLNNTTGDIIASGQAVFLQGSASGDITINFAETHKSASTQNGYFRTRSFNEMIRIAYMLDDTNKADEIIVRYANDNDVSNTKIGSMDIVSINAGTQYINSVKGTKGMAVQTRSLQTLSTDTVALNVKSNQSGTYKLNFSDYENFGANIYLLDNFTNTIHDVKASSTYSFTIDKNNAATQTNRFALVFSKAIPVTAITGVKVYPNPADKQITVQLPQTSDKYTVSITDVAGKRVYQSQLASGTQSINVAKFTSGNYIIEITDTKGNRTTEKLVKQ